MKQFAALAVLLWATAVAAKDPDNSFLVDSYVNSREKFRATCEALPEPKKCGVWMVPSKIDQDLSMDWVYANPGSSDKLVVFVGGLHGTEGFAGASLLHQLMAKWVAPMNAKGLHVLLIHSANPYGFKYLRRTTENNIDLNRNFPTTNEAIPRNVGYAKVKDVLQPEGSPGSILGGFLRLSFRLLTQLVTGQFSLADLRNAVAGGQREFPKGLFYGGTEPEPQALWMREFFKQTFANYKEIFVVDLHTGLGKRGVLHLMPSTSPSPAAVQLRERIFPKNDNNVFELTTEKSSGFYHVEGAFGEFAEQQVDKGQTVLALTMEFGTLGEDIFNQLRSLNRMVQENQGSQFGYTSNDSREDIEENFRELFYPSSAEWRAQLLQKGDAVFSLLQSNF